MPPPKKPTTKEPEKVSPKPTFPIVGIGASAGGLEALELFLANVPQESGMAFVIVQHLDPTHKGMIVELLQRTTKMPVSQIVDRMQIEPNRVYVIPPNRDLSILHGVLHLLEPVAPRGLRLPIDFFFRALADDLQEHSIGVILSGMGSDGTLGVRAIKEKAGVVFVQSRESAKFDGMPGSVIDAGLEDVVAPVEEIPEKIIAYLHHRPLISKSDYPDEPKSQSALEKIVILLRSQTGNDFSLYKKSTIYRRIERRMGLHQIDKIADYVRFLQENSQEVELLFRELLIGVTNFFRDPEIWKQLQTKVINKILEQSKSDEALRVWVPACSTGEEAYSLAILFREVIETLNPAKTIVLQIFATDLDQHAIDRAREGVFPANIITDVSPERLDRWFVKVERGYQVKKSIRELIIFAPQNVIMDPPFTKLSLISCRNLLIYLMPELQQKLLPLFHYSLNPGGYLFLGNAETVGIFTNLFKPLDSKTRLFQRLDSGVSTDFVEFPSAFVGKQVSTIPRTAQIVPNLQSLADQILLQSYAPAAVLTNINGDILYISGHTGKYLEPAAGKANWNIFAMSRDGLRYELTSGFQRALREKSTVVLKKLSVGTNGGKQLVNVTIQPLNRQDALDNTVMIIFNDVAELPALKKTASPPKKTSAHVAELLLELEASRMEVQATREQMQSSQEELKSTNEELQSMNEELQSTNEELTTSKEELQSMNEELHTVNRELQTNLDELARASNDLKNLLNSTSIATLFLDERLCVRRFTSEICHITKLIPGDVGRPITDIASALLYPDLAEDAHQVLKTLNRVERQIPIADGIWFQVRILPYRTLDNRIDGVVITFMDITQSKHLEADLRSTEQHLRELLGGKDSQG